MQTVNYRRLTTAEFWGVLLNSDQKTKMKNRIQI